MCRSILQLPARRLRETEMNREILVALSLLGFQGIISAEDWGVGADGLVGLHLALASNSSESAGTSTSPEVTERMVAEIMPEEISTVIPVKHIDDQEENETTTKKTTTTTTTTTCLGWCLALLVSSCGD